MYSLKIFIEIKGTLFQLKNLQDIFIEIDGLLLAITENVNPDANGFKGAYTLNFFDAIGQSIT